MPVQFCSTVFTCIVLQAISRFLLSTLVTHQLPISRSAISTLIASQLITDINVGALIVTHFITDAIQLSDSSLQLIAIVPHATVLMVVVPATLSR